MIAVKYDVAINEKKIDKTITIQKMQQCDGRFTVRSANATGTSTAGYCKSRLVAVAVLTGMSG